MDPVLAQDSKENADFKLAVSLYDDRLYDLALEQFRAFISLYPKTIQNAEAQFYLGLTQSKLGKHSEARFTFQNFALEYSDDPKAAEAWMNAAEEYAIMKNEREAAMAYERVKTSHPKSKFAPAALLKSAEFYEKIGEKSEAYRILCILTQEYNTSEVIPARLKLAEILIYSGQYDQAQKECKLVLQSETNAPIRSRALFLLGESLIGLGKYFDAETTLSDIMQNYRSTPSFYDASFAFGNLKILSGKDDDALAAWQSIIDDKNKVPKQLFQDACLKTAEANNHLRLYKRALSSFDQASHVSGFRNSEAFYKAGVAAERIGNLKKAAEYYTKAFKDSISNFDNRPVIIGAFKSAKITKDYSEAVRLVKDYRQKFPDDENLQRLLIEGAAIANKELNDSKTALLFCEYLLEHFPTSEWVDDAVYMIGEVQFKNGNIDSALSEFEKIRLQFPSSEFVQSAEKQIRVIKSFDQRGKDAGTQKLALLVGDMLSQKSKGDLAYRLAEIYFNDLKDYQLAAEQYANALNMDIDAALRPDAWLKQGQSFELLSLKYEERSGKWKENLLKAIYLYDSLAVLFPAWEKTDKAVVASFILRLQLADKAEEAQAIITGFLSKSSVESGKDIALLSLGDFYFNADDYDNSILLYGQLLEKYPDSKSAPSAQFKLGISLDKTMKNDSALLVIEDYLSKYSNNLYSASAAVFLGKAASDNVRLENAIDCFDLLGERYYYSPLSSNIDVWKADAYFAAGDFKNARILYEKSLKKIQTDYFIVNANPDAEYPAIFNLAVCCKKLNDTAAAEKWLSEYVIGDQKTAKAAQAYHSLASIAKEENNIDLAAEYLENVSRIEAQTGGSTASVAIETAEMLFQNEKYSKAIVKYNDALAQIKEDSLQNYLRSRIIVSNYRLDNLNEAEKLAAELLRPKFEGSRTYAAEFEFERGKFLMRKEELLKARERFDNVVISYRNTWVVPEALFWLGRVYETGKKYLNAAHAYDSLIRNYPDHKLTPQARLNLGNVYFILERWESASMQYRTIIEDERKMPHLVPLAMSKLIITYKEMGLYDNALEFTRKYIHDFPNDPELNDKKIGMGIIYQNLKYYDQSILQFQSLVDAGNPDVESELRYYIGESYFYKGDFQQAILEFLKVPYLVGKKGKVDWLSTSYYMAGQSYEKLSKYDKAMLMYQKVIDRKDTDTQFKTAAKKEIDRVKNIIEKQTGTN